MSAYGERSRASRSSAHNATSVTKLRPNYMRVRIGLRALRATFSVVKMPPLIAAIHNL